MSEKKKRNIRRGIHLGVVFGVTFAIFLVASNISYILPNSMLAKDWQMVATADGNPGDGESGVLCVMVYAHQGTPATAYASNLSNSSGDCYAFYDYLNHTLTGDVPYDTTFDIVVKCRANTTHAWNSTGSCWELDWIRANATCSDLSFSMENLSMVETEICNDSTYIYVHYYLQDLDGGAGTGFTISHGETVNVTYFKFEAYF